MIEIVGENKDRGRGLTRGGKETRREVIVRPIVVSEVGVPVEWCAARGAGEGEAEGPMSEVVIGRRSKEVVAVIGVVTEEERRMKGSVAAVRRVIRVVTEEVRRGKV